MQTLPGSHTVLRSHRYGDMSLPPACHSVTYLGSHLWDGQASEARYHKALVKCLRDNSPPPPWNEYWDVDD